MEDQELILSLVTSHLEKLTPGLAEEFKVRWPWLILLNIDPHFITQSRYPSRTMVGKISFEDVVRHYVRTAPDRLRLEEIVSLKKEGDSSGI